ncbi:hypothetical protein D910_12263 [Dendroctonus ponderosae]
MASASVSSGVSYQTFSYLLLALLGANSTLADSDKVDVKINTDNFDGTITVPKWVLAHAAEATLGYIPTGVFDGDDALPSSIKLEPDWFIIQVEMNTFEQDPDKIKVKVLDSETVQVEVKQKHTNRYGVNTSRTVTRSFMVPRTYDVDETDARLTSGGVLIIRVPKTDGTVITITKIDHVIYDE